MLDLPISSLLADSAALRDKVVLITGGASGFGRRAALYAAEQGAHIIVVDLNQRSITRVLAELRQFDGESTTPPDPTDVTKPEAVRAAFDWSLTTYGRPPDVVIANAGVTLEDHFEADGEISGTSSKPAHPRAPRDLTFKVNWDGLLTTCEVAQELWTKHPLSEPRGGIGRKLVLLASMGGIGGIPLGTIYSMSKHATMGYWEGICKDLQAKGGEAGFQCYTICPFFANTPILPPPIIFLLSGIPVVSIDRVAQAMIYASTRPAGVSHGPGGAILIPDDHEPLLASVEEYKPIDPSWSTAVESRVLKKSDSRKESGFSAFFRDLATNFFKVSQTTLAVRMIAGLALIGTATTVGVMVINRLPLWATTLLGAGLAALVRVNGSRSKGKRKGKSSK